MNKTQPLIPMIQFILDIDWLTTKEFCDIYQVPHPKFTGEVESSVNNLLQVDAIKHKMFVDYSKLLNKKITADILMKNLGFECIEPNVYKNLDRIITFEYDTFWRNCGHIQNIRVERLQDLTNLELIFTK